MTHVEINDKWAILRKQGEEFDLEQNIAECKAAYEAAAKQTKELHGVDMPPYEHRYWYPTGLERVI